MWIMIYSAMNWVWWALPIRHLRAANLQMMIMMSLMKKSVEQVTNSKEVVSRQVQQKVKHLYWIILDAI